jgi:hypothetical protein
MLVKLTARFLIGVNPKIDDSTHSGDANNAKAAVSFIC